MYSSSQILVPLDFRDKILPFILFFIVLKTAKNSLGYVIDSILKLDDWILEFKEEFDELLVAILSLYVFINSYLNYITAGLIISAWQSAPIDILNLLYLDPLIDLSYL